MTTPADDALIAILRENARASTAEIARRLGVSRTTVQSRIERLESKGVIAGYTLRLAQDYADSLIRAHVQLTILPKLIRQVEAGLRAIPAVRMLHSVSGNFDMIAVIEARSVGELDALADRIGALDGVERTSTSLILSTRIDR
jgi:DNA-binding Lrp family transcriptional regulator